MARPKANRAQKTQNPFCERFEDLIKKSGKTQEQIEQEWGLGVGQQRAYCETTPSQLLKLWEVADKAGVSRAWVTACFGPKDPKLGAWLHGLGLRIEASPDLQGALDVALGIYEKAKGIDPVNIKSLEKKYATVNRRAELEVYERRPAAQPTGAIPTWLHAAAGPGMLLELSEDYWYIPRLARTRGIHQAVIRGDSMRETLVPGDMIVMQSLPDETVLPEITAKDRKQKLSVIRSTIKDDHIYALSLNGQGVTIKRVLMRGDDESWFMMIVADNPNEWEPITIARGDEVRFYARVLGISNT